MRVNAFERTGCLITMIPSEHHDSKIKPQGMKPESFVVPCVEPVNDGGDAGSSSTLEQEGQSTEEAALEEERRIMEEQKEDEEKEEDLFVE